MTRATPSPSARAFLALLPDLTRSARRLSRSGPDAEDLVQETLLRVWSRLAMAQQGASDAAPITDVRAYAFATLRHAAMRQSPAPIDPDTIRALPAPPDQAPAQIAAADALAALDQIPAEQARLLRLRALNGLSYAEIAETTGLPMGTVTSRMSRGRAALRRVLGLPRGAPVSDLFRGD